MSQIAAQIDKQDKLLKKEPEVAGHWFRMGRLQRLNSQFRESIIALSRCVALEPNNLEAWCLMGFSFLDLFKMKEALECFVFALNAEPTRAEAVFGCALTQEMLGNHADALEFIDHAVALEPDNQRFYPLRAYLHATYTRDAAKSLPYFREWAERFADPYTYAAKEPVVDRTPGRKLRIGYVSGDLRNHSVAFFVEPIFARHNRDNVHVSAFSTGAADAVTKRIRSTVDAWFDISTMSDDAICSLIRRQKIDVLIDLSGHTVGNRLMVFARRAAPVQLTWLGFMYTTGLAAMNYRITDAIADPPGVSEDGHSELLFRVKRMAIYQPPPAQLYLEPPVNRRGKVIFGSLNHLKKVTDHMLGVWKRILDEVPESILLVIASEMSQEEAIAGQRPRLEAAGLSMDRLCILPRMGLDSFMDLGKHIDIALDTAPLSGGTTTLHSLWMGLPVVCMKAGQGFANSSAATVSALGMPELASDDEEGYIRAAVSLANSPEKLAEFRAGIRPRMEQSYLMDYAGFVADMDAAFRLMWLNYLYGEAVYLDTNHDVQAAVAECVANGARRMPQALAA
jgi:predicted O-linked N-acetylglucosamine transferase (SPINDLY family)